MNWINVNSNIKPPTNRVLICYCPEWCLDGYQVATWSGKKFEYDAQPNDDFHGLVKKWAIFLEAD